MLNHDFREFAELLNANGAEYLLVGGYALAAYGHPRYTGYIDFWVSVAPPNVARLLKLFDDFGFASLGLRAHDFNSDTVVQLGRPPSRIGLLSSIDGVEFDACWSRRQTIDVDGLALHMIGLDDFKANKRSAGRAKVLADLQALEGPPRD
ncbi:MAG: hypothetical protein LH480_02235 [Rubrivivax sp.]|nr:hypothetical protein [Rubrivivax sp.]